MLEMVIEREDTQTSKTMPSVKDMYLAHRILLLRNYQFITY